MAKIKIGGVEYTLYTDELSRYDGYYYKDDILKYEPIDTRVVGYVKEDGMRIAICKATHKKLYPFIYGGFGVATVAVGIMCVIAFNPHIEVPHWEPGNHDNVIGELDDGNVQISKKFKYNQYATYDGENVTVAVYSKGKEFALKVGEMQSDYVKSGTNLIPMALDILPQDIRQAKLLVKSGDEVEEYPLVIERFNNTPVELAQGSEDDFEAGVSEMGGVLQEIAPKDPEPEYDPDTAWNNYTDNDYNFEDFPVIKDPQSKGRYDPVEEEEEDDPYD